MQVVGHAFLAPTRVLIHYALTVQTSWQRSIGQKYFNLFGFRFTLLRLVGHYMTASDHMS
jgi:hypothetical protein